jgi:hypothetical protein
MTGNVQSIKSNFNEPRQKDSEMNTDSFTRKERRVKARLTTGIWNLRWIRRGYEEGTCPLYMGEEAAKHTICY